MKIHHRLGAGLASIFLCLTMLGGFIPARAAAPDGGEKFSDIVQFQSITLHYAGDGGQPEGAAIQDNTLLARDRELVLRYTYQITEEQCKRIAANTPYYLEVSPHLTLPHLEGGAVLSVDTGPGRSLLERFMRTAPGSGLPLTPGRAARKPAARRNPGYAL